MTHVAIVHDYLTQKGGAERVVLSMRKAFPEAPIYTSLFNPNSTFPEFADADVRTTYLDRVPFLRSHHRLALPVLALTFSHLTIPAEVVLCSSSGWAHGVSSGGRKIVYCHTPARWLYQADHYLGVRQHVARGVLTAFRKPLARWDRRSALTAGRYLTQSQAVQARIRAAYGLDAEVLPAPWTLDPHGPKQPIQGIAPGFFLCVSRLLPYKNVDRVLAAFSNLPQFTLVVAGSGPDYHRLRAGAPSNACFLNQVSDDQLAWLYANCRAVVAASHEDYGLTPIEAAAFGKPSVVLRWGGFLDTVEEGATGIFFDVPDPVQIRKAVERVSNNGFDANKIRSHASKYSETRFIQRLREIVSVEGLPE